MDGEELKVWQMVQVCNCHLENSLNRMIEACTEFFEIVAPEQSDIVSIMETLNENRDDNLSREIVEPQLQQNDQSDNLEESAILMAIHSHGLQQNDDNSSVSSNSDEDEDDFDIADEDNDDDGDSDDYEVRKDDEDTSSDEDSGNDEDDDNDIGSDDSEDIDEDEDSGNEETDDDESDSDDDNITNYNSKELLNNLDSSDIELKNSASNNFNELTKATKSSTNKETVNYNNLNFPGSSLFNNNLLDNFNNSENSNGNDVIVSNLMETAIAVAIQKQGLNLFGSYSS